MVAALAGAATLGVAACESARPARDAATSPPVSAHASPAGSILIVAHRGDVDRFPENTAEAIWAAADLGVDGIEMDVHRSADGTWWVIHDPTLDRTTDRTGRIAELGDMEIAAAIVDGGHGYRPEVHQELRVPRLTAVLEGLKDYAGRIYLDVKHASSGDATELVALVAGHPLTILCRDEREVAAIEALDPAVQTVLLLSEAGSGSQADAFLVEAVEEASARQVRDAGRPVIAWVNEARADGKELSVLRRSQRNGVSAFLTKHPAAALAQIGR
jgi:glycerophosphoryl diester phosphodiesterase